MTPININELKKNPKAIVFFFLGLILNILLLGASYFLWIKDSGLKSEMPKKKAEVNKKQASSADIRSLTREIDRLRAEIDKQAFSNIEEIFVFINQCAASSKINLVALEPLKKTDSEKKVKGKPGAASAKKLITDTAFSAKIKCDYFQLYNFLKIVENAEKTITIDSVSIESDPHDLWSNDIRVAFKALLLSPR